MCPMRMTGMPVHLAKWRSIAVTSLIWVTEPADDSTLAENIVWTESTTMRSGFRASAWAMMLLMSVSLKMKQLESSPPSLSARILTCLALSSPET